MLTFVGEACLVGYGDGARLVARGCLLGRGFVPATTLRARALEWRMPPHSNPLHGVVEAIETAFLECQAGRGGSNPLAVMQRQTHWPLCAIARTIGRGRGGGSAGRSA